MIAIPEPGELTPEDVELPRSDGRSLRAWLWKRDDPRGALIIVHGLGEHGGVYRQVAELIGQSLGIDVLAIDLRGHGRSSGRRGAVERYEDLVDDLQAAVDWAARERPDLPRFVLGHSNGGLVSILAALRDPSTIDGLILSSPALRLKYDPPRLKVLIGHVLHAVAPWVTLAGPLPVEGLTRDPLQQVVLRSDRLYHTRINAPLYFGMLDRGADALERAGALDLPLLLLLGGDDPIIDPDGGRAFFDRYGGGSDKTLLDLPDLRHNPLFELGRERVYRAVLDWLAPRLLASARSDGDGVPRGSKETSAGS